MNANERQPASLSSSICVYRRSSAARLAKAGLETHSRRVFLKGAALSLCPRWLARAASAAENRRKVLVVVFQRGAVDGLNVVVPYSDPDYYSLRPGIAIPQRSLIQLDARFGLHPALEPLNTLWNDRRLAIIHAAGSPDPTRSHFDAQDYMESGTPGRKATRDGWLNRAVPAGGSSPVSAVAMGPTLPRTLRGARPALAVNGFGQFRVADQGSAAAFESLYDSATDPVLAAAGRETFEAVKALETIQNELYTPAAPYPPGRFGEAMQQIARLIKSGVGLEVAFADMGGWDTHVNEVGAQPTEGQLANLLREFGAALAAFYRDLDARMDDVLLVTMSEFGRTARENGNRGTDHGHANVMLVFGGGIRGGRVYGEWPGLATEQLYEGRDLALTTDFRDVLGELVAGHLGCRNLEAVFPGYTPRFRGIMRSS